MRSRFAKGTVRAEPSSVDAQIADDATFTECPCSHRGAWRGSSGRFCTATASLCRRCKEPVGRWGALERTLALELLSPWVVAGRSVNLNP